MKHLVSGIVLTLLGSAALAQEDGAALFAQNCAACHGVEARGDGPLTALLTIEVPDLTGISARNGGEFPLPWVIEMIDGTSTVRAHGGPMPVFGRLLADGEGTAADAPDGTPVIVGKRIAALADYLHGLQE